MKKRIDTNPHELAALYGMIAEMILNYLMNPDLKQKFHIGHLQSICSRLVRMVYSKSKVLHLTEIDIFTLKPAFNQLIPNDLFSQNIYAKLHKILIDI